LVLLGRSGCILRVQTFESWCPESAWGAFSAGFLGSEPADLPGEFVGGCPAIEGDHPAVADSGADPGQFLEPERGVEVLREDDSGQGAPEEDPLDRGSIGQSASVVLDDFS
jgi:hypothetical protein